MSVFEEDRARYCDSMTNLDVPHSPAMECDDWQAKYDRRVLLGALDACRVENEGLRDDLAFALAALCDPDPLADKAKLRIRRRLSIDPALQENQWRLFRETRPVEKVSPAKQHADGYRKGWAAALEAVLREVEDLPSERIETGGAIAPWSDGGHQPDEYVEVIGLGNVLAVIREAIGE